MHRKRLERHEGTGQARFLTFSCLRRLPLFRNDAIKDRFVERLTECVARCRVAVLAWVVMPEHVHLVVHPEEDATIAAFYHALKKPFAAEVIRRWKSLAAPILPAIATPDGHSFWQPGGGFDRDVWDEELLEKVRYTHANPVKRGLADRSIDYRWSSARAFEGLDCIGPPVAFDLIPKSNRPLT